MEIFRPTSSDSQPSRVPVSSVPVSAPTLPSTISQTPAPRLELEDLYCILQIDPNDSFMAMELARRLRARGRLDEALRIQQNILKIDYRFETLHALAQTEYELDLIDDSFANLQHALLIAPEHSPLFFDLFKTLGNIFVRRGDLDSAEDSYHKAHRLNPESDPLQVNFGTLAIQRGQWDEAVPHFRRALEINRVNDKAWVGLAICHRMKGDGELAWGNVEAALEYNPQNEVALSFAVDWGTQEGRESRVLELIRNFLIEGGWNEKMSLAFVWLSWRRGEVAVARFELERLLAVNPTNAQALNLLQDMKARP